MAALLTQKHPADQGALDAVCNELRELLAPRHRLPANAKFVGKAQLDAASTKKWLALQKQSTLADLPPKAQVQLLAKEAGWDFRFHGARADVRAWLLASLSEKMQKANADRLAWPDAPLPFERFYLLMNHCVVSLYSPDGLTIHVMIQRPRPSRLIAPDEATPPMPKTAAPQELNGVVEAPLDGPLAAGPDAAA